MTRCDYCHRPLAETVNIDNLARDFSLYCDSECYADYEEQSNKMAKVESVCTLCGLVMISKQGIALWGGSPSRRVVELCEPCSDAYKRYQLDAKEMQLIESMLAKAGKE